MPELKTYSGNMIDPLALSFDGLDVKDVAHALSNLCRYAGHVHPFYSVAQHALHVSHVAERLAREQLAAARMAPAEVSVLAAGVALQGLHHDDAEGLGLGDVVGTVKAFAFLWLPSDWLDDRGARAEDYVQVDALGEDGASIKVSFVPWEDVEDWVLQAVSRLFGFQWPMSDLVAEADALLLATEGRDLYPRRDLGTPLETMHIRPVSSKQAMALWMGRHATLTHTLGRARR